MKLNKIFLFILAVFALNSCYKDLGTSEKDYHDINELTIEGIEELYARDVDDSLKISPKIEGTMYSDTNKFSYAWDISNRIVSTQLNLDIKVEMLPGNKISRFIIEDKETKVRKYVRFSLNVSSSTAGNLIMVLSKSNGKAELSYLRLDKEANWSVNYFESRYGRPLGINPQKLGFIMTEDISTTNRCAPFVNAFGRVLVLADDQLASIDKRTLEPAIIPYLTGESFTGIASYPPPNTTGYKPEFMAEGINIWRSNAYGTGFQQLTEFQLISGGALYFASLAPSVWSPSFYYNNKSVYGANGYFSAFGYYDGMIPTADGTLYQHGYTLGNFIVFDKVYGRFAYSGYGASYSIPTTSVKAFPGHDLVYGSASSQSGTSFAVLKAPGNDLRFILLGKTGSSTYSLAGEVGGGVATVASSFYTMKTSPYTFFSAGNKLYKYNILDIKSNSVPSENNAVVSLTNLGYTADAVITSMCVSRTENSLIVGVSRYGNDKEGVGAENKGDVLVFNLDKVSLGLTLRKKYEGVSGIPVDVKIKYQTHWRDGKSNGGVTVLDNI